MSNPPLSLLILLLVLNFLFLQCISHQCMIKQDDNLQRSFLNQTEPKQHGQTPHLKMDEIECLCHFWWFLLMYGSMLLFSDQTADNFLMSCKRKELAMSLPGGGDSTSCVPMTNVKWREVKPHHEDAPVTLQTCWPLHHTSFRLLVKDMMVEFLSNDLKTKKALILITFNGFMSLVQQ